MENKRWKPIMLGSCLFVMLALNIDAFAQSAPDQVPSAAVPVPGDVPATPSLLELPANAATVPPKGITAIKPSAAKPPGQSVISTSPLQTLAVAGPKASPVNVPVTANTTPALAEAPAPQVIATSPPVISSSSETSAPGNENDALSLPSLPANVVAAHGAANEKIVKDPNVLLVPVHLGNTSVFFSKDDMDILAPFIEAYDKTGHMQKTGAMNVGQSLLAQKNNLLGLLKHDEAPTPMPLPLPSLYLGSIVYYSPGNWSVWINGKKLVNARNGEKNEFYITRISRSEIELVWKPASLLNTPALWKQLTDNGKNPLPNITIDESKGIITLRMHPNQTFLPRSLAIREGLIKPNTEPLLLQNAKGPVRNDKSNAKNNAPGPAIPAKNIPSQPPSAAMPSIDSLFNSTVLQGSQK